MSDMAMDSTLYIRVLTGRGFSYSVYYSKGSDAKKPALLFLHGFPSSSYDWRHQVAYFELRGHTVIVPDMLGYGGTDKPTNAEAYAFSLVAQDVIDLLDALHGEERVIVIGHDWGSRIVGFLANLHTHRFVGFAFLAVGYNAPNPTISYSQLLAYTAQLTGQERFGYWSFFSEDGTDQIIKDRLDSFFSYLISLRFEDAPNFTPTGAYKATLLKNEVSPLPSFITQEEYDTQKVTFAKSGIIAPLCWYRVATSSIGREDSKKVPLDKYTVATPVFLAVAKEDPVAVPGMVIASTLKFCTNTTVREYDAGHWVLWEAKDQVNADLEQWIASL